MIIIKEIELKGFEFWGGAKDIANLIEDDEFYIIEELLEALYPDGITETQVNDFFWFEGDTIAQALGYVDEEDMLDERGLQ